MIFNAVFRECVKCQYLVMIHCVTAAAAHWAPCLGWALMGRDQEQDTGHCLNTAAAVPLGLPVLTNCDPPAACAGAKLNRLSQIVDIIYCVDV